MFIFTWNLSSQVSTTKKKEECVHKIFLLCFQPCRLPGADVVCAVFVSMNLQKVKSQVENCLVCSRKKNKNFSSDSHKYLAWIFMRKFFCCATDISSTLEGAWVTTKNYLFPPAQACFEVAREPERHCKNVRHSSALCSWHVERIVNSFSEIFTFFSRLLLRCRDTLIEWFEIFPPHLFNWSCQVRLNATSSSELVVCTVKNDECSHAAAKLSLNFIFLYFFFMLLFAKIRRSCGGARNEVREELSTKYNEKQKEKKTTADHDLLVFLIKD